MLAYFSAAGGGRFSVDEHILGGELAFYEGAINKLKGGPLE